jgi:hypothetical protein
MEFTKILEANIKGMNKQGMPTEGEDSVQLASSLK